VVLIDEGVHVMSCARVSPIGVLVCAIARDQSLQGLVTDDASVAAQWEGEGARIVCTTVSRLGISLF